MAEYIEREALLAKLKPDEPGDDRAAVLVCDVRKILREFAMMIPAADVAPVVHGRWIIHNFENECGTGEEFECSVCHKYEYLETDYCPHCGARMDMDGE